MAQFDVSAIEGIGKLNKHLTLQSYMTGYSLSADDVAQFNAFAAAPSEKFANVLRWYRHIASFSAEERAAAGAPASGSSSSSAAPAAAAAEPAAAKKAAAEDEEDFDLFGDDDDGEHEAEIERRAQEQLAKKAASGKKVINKSAIVFEVKPMGTETDLVELERLVRGIQMEGLNWGEGRLEEICFGVKKLVISCLIIDDLVSSDIIEERIYEFEELVQSVDIASFSKAS